MPTISELKEQAVTETPLLLFDCVWADGTLQHWSTHRVTAGGTTYEARVLRHTLFEIQTASDQEVDGVPRVTLVLANADSHFSQLERSKGMKGARLTAKFVFHDLVADLAASEAKVVFQGVCNPAEEITETSFRVTATNRMNMQRVLLPPVRIQRRCPWNFPTTAAQRQEAVDGGAQGKYSRFYRCGYSPDIVGGAGNIGPGGPFVVCNYTRQNCTERGMFQNFGGLEFVPSSIQVRSYGDKSSHTSAIQENTARYNDFVPVVYGTAWYTPPVVFARNDGNLTRMEVLLGIGEIQGVLKVLVNDVEIPPGQAGTNMTGTGWYNMPAAGTRAGGFNLDFKASDGTPAGDPYGSMAYLAVVVPNRINDGGTLPRVKVLAQGLKVPVYGSNGIYVGEQFSNNPAWVLLDVLRRSGWTGEELDLASFAKAAAYCDEQVTAQDLNGNAITLPRFQCNLALRTRRSAGDLIRGIRNGSRLYITYGSSGVLELRVENSIALQQPAKPEGSNAAQPVNGGWPAYEFGDGTYGLSGILRRDSGEPSVRIWARNSADTGNRLAVEFQDAMNEYQQDSFSLVDADDVAKVGQEVTAPPSTLGIPNYDQAARILKFNLDKSLRGNLYVEFESSVKALGLRPGDLITITYLKEGFDRQVFRVLKIAPGNNYATARITAQIHDDAWYSDTNGRATPAAGGWRENGAGIGIPRPIAGTSRDSNGEAQFGVEEAAVKGTDGAVTVNLTVSFTPPTSPAGGGPAPPLLDLSPTISIGGSLGADGTLFYAVSAVDAAGAEGPLSFIVRAGLSVGGGKSVRLTGLSFSKGAAAFHVYRGRTPAQLGRIASNQAIASEFIDTGAGDGLIPAPDASYDHANFYWRSELQPELPATIQGGSTVGNGTLQMAPNRYRGSVVRITRGKGAAQERVVSSNTGTALTVTPPWDIAPDGTSYFVVAEGGWKFGALSASSPVRFEVPNRPGEVVQILGRAANVNDGECAAELSPVTRWTIGGDSGRDSAVPPAPVFGIGAGRGEGSVEVSGVSFPDLTNTHTITAGTLTVYYWNELLGQPARSLAGAVAATDTLVDLDASGTPQAGSFVQLEAEVARVEEVLNNGTRYRLTRGMHGTAPAAHALATPVYHLDSKTVVMPFPRQFFGSPYSANWSHPISLPDVRVASAELFVTNQQGNGPTASLNLTQLQNFGLRTLSGGQYTIQVEGRLAIDAAAAPPLVVESSHSVRDVFAVLGAAADAPVDVRVNMNGTPLGTVTVPAAQTVSNSLDGFSLPPLTAGARISVSILSVGLSNPGADLTVVIRL